jgi:hypothetical protein
VEDSIFQLSSRSFSAIRMRFRITVSPSLKASFFLFGLRVFMADKKNWARS